ncbi:MAG: riboflavin kinase [bacterium]|nr:riboflavin kinase [bacterium]
MTIISGKIVKGRGLGKKMGFPTLNIPYKGSLRGVFAGRVFVDGKWLSCALNIGPRPTINDEKVFLEAYIIDWDGDIGEGVEIEVLDRIRDIKKFDSLEDLKVQIAKDIEFVRMCATE